MTFSEAIERARTFDPEVNVCIPRTLAVQIMNEYAARMVSAEIDGVTTKSRELRAIVQALEFAIVEKAQVVL